MAASVVYENVAEGAKLETGKLFEGRKLWVAQRVPHRGKLLDLIKANGGQIVLLEKQADWMIADHFRRDCPPGTTSYDFVHKSIAKGEVLDPDDYPAGPRVGTARDPGSLARPAKGGRNAFTPDEDRTLYKWVTDAAASGLAVSGNELYKQLEQKCPRHTWQSWRDRYLKKLQGRPPSAFNVPDNAPPSPPSDQSSRVAEAPAVRKSVLVKNKDRARAVTVEEASTSMGTASSKEPAAKKEKYTVDQLAATFTTEDWESLYAFVEEIDSCSGNRESYESSWISWAENKDNQTAEQWRQYYEKVVRPQWLRDPVSKRSQIRKKVEDRYQDVASSPVKGQSWSHTQDANVAASRVVESASKRTQSNETPPDSRLASESTAQNETPRYIRDGYESALKRIRGEVDDSLESKETARPTKVRRQTDLSLEQKADFVGTQEQPLEASFATRPQQESAEQEISDEAAHTQSQAAQVIEVHDLESDEDLPTVTPLRRPLESVEDDEDIESIASSTDLAHLAPISRPLRIPEDEDDDDDDASNTSTPRATKVTNFDTQAILSSPSQLPIGISKLPRPSHNASQHPISSSPPHHPDSEASTTQSLQEFSSYLQEPARPEHARSTSPTPSAASSTSTSSGDPDVPLHASEFDDFFNSQHLDGHSSDLIINALKRTRFRPDLAAAVLEAWKRGAPLPDRRGVWSEREDELVQSGDGAALARLERKHSLDGWGGITERMNFLSAWAGR